MLIFGDMPLPVQNFLSDFAEELVSANSEVGFSKPEIIETLCPLVEDLSNVISQTLDHLKNPPESSEGPFHLVIGPTGLQVRSTRNRFKFSDQSMFDLMWHLLRLQDLEHAILHALKAAFGNLALGERTFDSLLEEFLQTLSTQFSFTCAFSVPPQSNTPHENSATFQFIEGSLKALCDSNEDHVVHIEE